MKIRNLSIFFVHASAEEKTEEEKVALAGLDREMEKIGKGEEYVEITGRHSRHTVTNSNGECHMQFAASHGLRIRSTAFPHKGTWTPTDDRTIYQIHYVLIDS
ncbi:hypothetical protein Trydic_g6214 [Trypoxylus dichotomus]